MIFTSLSIGYLAIGMVCMADFKPCIPSFRVHELRLQRHNSPIINLQLNGKNLTFLADTGCGPSFINKDIAFYKLPNLQYRNTDFQVATLSRVAIIPQQCEIFIVKIGDITFRNVTFLATPFGSLKEDVAGIGYDGILGMDLLERIGASIDFANGRLTYFDPEARDRICLFGEWKMTHGWQDGKFFRSRDKHQASLSFNLNSLRLQANLDRVEIQCNANVKYHSLNRYADLELDDGVYNRVKIRFNHMGTIDVLLMDRQNPFEVPYDFIFLKGKYTLLSFEKTSVLP